MSYQSLIEERGIRILIEEMIGDYQGDWLFFVKQGRKYGFVSVGYGSCSGCDAYDAAMDDGTLDELGEEIVASIEWFDSLKSAKQYVGNAYERALQWYYHESGWDDFAREVSEYRAR